MIVAPSRSLGACAESIEIVAATVSQYCDIIFVRMIVNMSKLLWVRPPSRQLAKELNCWTAAITKKHRNIYERTYPTIMILPDGSSINVSYHEPRKIIAIPLDINTLSETERKVRLELRKPRIKVKIVQEIEDDFDENRYLKFLKTR